MSQTSLAQETGLLVMKETSALLSLTGSSLIIVCIIRQRHKRPIANDTLHQLLLGLSVSDWLSSFVILTGSFMVPEGALADFPWYAGNQATCTASAFGSTWSQLVAATYNGFLAIHFWMSVRISQRTVTTKRSKQVFRWVAHAVSILVGAGVAFAGLIGEFYRPHPFLGVCYYSVKGSETARIIGRSRLFYRYTVTGIAILCTVTLACKVQATLKKSSRYSSSWDVLARPSDLSASAVPPSNRRNSGLTRIASSVSRADDNTEKMKREVLYQSCWYLLAYLNTFAPSFVAWICVNADMDVPISQRRGETGVYMLLLFYWSATPFQGFLNFVAFIRPRYYAWKSYLESENEGRKSFTSSTNDQEDLDDATPATKQRHSLFYVLYMAVKEDAPCSFVSQRNVQERRSNRNAVVTGKGSGSSRTPSGVHRENELEEAHPSDETFAMEPSSTERMLLAGMHADEA